MQNLTVGSTVVSRSDQQQGTILEIYAGHDGRRVYLVRWADGSEAWHAARTFSS